MHRPISKIYGDNYQGKFARSQELFPLMIMTLQENLHAVHKIDNCHTYDVIHYSQAICFTISKITV